MREGVRLPWKNKPTPRTLHQKELSPEEQTFFDKELQRMLESKAVEPMPEGDQASAVFSPVFTVPKADSNDRRPINNLKWVNTHVLSEHFKMATMRDVKACVTRDCWMAKIDLKDCFWQLLVHEADRKYLAFRWRGKAYQFRSLPFGLNVSPRFITKLFKPVLAALHKTSHRSRCVIYIDDMILFGATREACVSAVKAAVALFSKLGVILNDKKSCLIPSQQIDYLGFSLDSVKMTIQAPPRKIKNVRTELRKFLNRPHSSPRQVASVLGKLGALADALFPTRVHTTGLHQLQLKGQATSWDCPTLHSKEALAMEDANWWMTMLPSLNSKLSLCYL